MAFKILAINPGSTSTKISFAIDNKLQFVADIPHTKEQLSPFKKISDQYHFRKQVVIEELKKRNVPLYFDAIIGRGGLAKPVSSGVFTITKQMILDQEQAKHQHACDLGCMIADEIAQDIPNCKSFIADPGVVDELEPEARISGSPLLPRVCIWHALNQKAIARRFAKDIQKPYKELNLIICHLGGGVSIAAHKKGKAIDANNALDGEGPFSPERAGSLPAGDLIRLCFSGKYSEEQLLRKVSGKAGLMAHLGSNNLIEVMNWIESGDKHAEAITSAMIWHIAKNIAAESAVLKGHIDAILLTGGMAKCDYIINGIKERIDFLAPVYVYPGQDEMQALTENALSVLKGEQIAQEY